MKVGILTYHRSENYGAVLQAVALRIVLERMGHQIKYIDYFPDYHRKIYQIAWSSWKDMRHPRSYFKHQRDCMYRLCRKLRFKQFQNKYIVPYCSDIKSSYDIVIYGSDQIWRKQPYINQYNPIYFGENDITTKKNISYAASSDRGPVTLEEKTNLKQLLSNLDTISVRESWLQDTIKDLGFESELVIDPTLLLTKEDWEETISPQKKPLKKYLLFYELQPGSFDESEISKFAKNHDLEIIHIVGTAYYNKEKGLYTTAGPTEFINYIKNAEIVFSSSFHGVVFAINFHKPFYTSLSHNAKRVESLLTTIQHSHLLLRCEGSIPMSYPEMDFDKINKEISKLRNASLRFLKDTLNPLLCQS